MAKKRKKTRSRRGLQVVTLCISTAMVLVLLGLVVFSVLTLYYIGYPLLVAYVYFALRQYFRHNRAHYVCGNCGHTLHRKGVCPHCGVENI